MQKHVFLIGILIFLFTISGWSQKTKTTSSPNNLKYYQNLGASNRVATLMTKMTIDEKEYFEKYKKIENRIKEIQSN